MLFIQLFNFYSLFEFLIVSMKRFFYEYLPTVVQFSFCIHRISIKYFHRI